MKHCMSVRVVLVILLFLFSGCVHKDFRPRKNAPSIASQMKLDSDSLGKKQKIRSELFEKQAQKLVNVKPLLPKYDPLEDHKISFSMVDEKLETVLYLLADTVGMNLIMDEKLKAQHNRVTISFQDVSAKTVLKELADQFDFDYKIEENIIRINTVAERFFSLNFLDTNIKMGFDVGGDVLGGGGTKTASGLAGSVTMKGSGAEKANPYVILEEMINKVKSKEGVLSINKLSGSLYIKDKPSIVKTVATMLSRFKAMLSRQILIEARIIEVTLSKGHEYGIDWDLVRASSPGASPKLTKLAWNLTNGLVLSGFNDSYTLTAAINALKAFGNVKIVSNPTIRAKNGSPAIISVGDSITYKKSVERIIEKTDQGQTETTSVEVSTVFDGLILGVIPFIEANGKISLLINPIKSDVDTESISKPETVGTGVSISLPKVGIKEISTAISINDGDMVIIGGLISSEDVKRDKGVPFISKVPILGYLFKNEYVSKERKELVIILNVRII